MHDVQVYVYGWYLAVIRLCRCEKLKWILFLRHLLCTRTQYWEHARAVVFNLGVMTLQGLHYPSKQWQNYIYDVTMKIHFGWGHHTWWTVLKGGSIRKAESRCSLFYVISIHIQQWFLKCDSRGQQLHHLGTCQDCKVSVELMNSIRSGTMQCRF